MSDDLYTITVWEPRLGTFEDLEFRMPGRAAEWFAQRCNENYPPRRYSATNLRDVDAARRMYEGYIHEGWAYRPRSTSNG